VGELLENQFRIGWCALSVPSRKDVRVPGNVDRHAARLGVTPSRDGSDPRNSSLSQLSQFMDQTNPLSEITHKAASFALGRAV